MPEPTRKGNMADPAGAGLHVEVPRVGVVDDEGGGGLFGFELIAGGQPDADGVLCIENPYQLFLVFEIRTRAVAKAVALAAVLLVEDLLYFGSVISRDAEFLTDALWTSSARPSAASTLSPWK